VWPENLESPGVCGLDVLGEREVLSQTLNKQIQTDLFMKEENLGDQLSSVTAPYVCKKLPTSSQEKYFEGNFILSMLAINRFVPSHLFPGFEPFENNVPLCKWSARPQVLV
jgi:hypothetical protein